MCDSSRCQHENPCFGHVSAGLVSLSRCDIFHAIVLILIFTITLTAEVILHHNVTIVWRHFRLGGLASAAFLRDCLINCRHGLFIVQSFSDF